MDFIRELITRYRLQGRDSYHTNVTGVVNKIIRITGKDDGRYIVKDEVYLATIPGTPGVMRSSKPDKCIFQLIVLDEEPVLVIECKHHDSASQDFTADDRRQLLRYMIAASFPTGWLVSEYFSEFYKLNNDTLNATMTLHGQLDMLDDLDTIVEIVRNL